MLIICRSAATEGGSQTGNRGAVSNTGLVLDLQCAQRGEELLDEVVLLVVQGRAAEARDAHRAAQVPALLDAFAIPYTFSDPLVLAVALHKGVTKHVVRGLGVDTPDVPSDYPDASKAVAEAVLDGRAERAVLACGSGVGACIAANKFPGIYAAICHDTYSAHQGVEHDQMNILCIGARIIGEKLAEELVDAFVRAQFSGEERHQRRFDKVQAIEQEMLNHRDAEDAEK